MQETLINTYELEELKELPPLFDSLEELYIMLLDLVYTNRYECQEEYQSIVEYCIENNFLVNVQYQLEKFKSEMTEQEFIIGCLVILPTMVASCDYEMAIEFSLALLNDIETQIQDYHLDALIKEKYDVQIKLAKIFKFKIENQKKYLDIIHILLSVAYEGINEYQKALDEIKQLGEEDDSVNLACMRIRFNLIYQQNERFSVPLFEMAENSINEMIEDTQEFLNKIELVSYEKQKKTIFDYDQALMKYVSTLYLARLNTLINHFEQANEYYLELWQISPDDESYEESVTAYLDNFVRYSCGDKNDISLVTKSPLWYHFNSNNIRPEIVKQALNVAEDFSKMEDKQQLSAVSYYYLGHLEIVCKDYDKAVEYFRKAKDLNMTEYKYPSELVSVAWLPSMIDFDLLSVMLLCGKEEICEVNQPNYFDKILTNKNIVTILSPDRYEMAEILHVLFNLQRKFYEDDLLATDEVIELLVRVGMIDQEFAPRISEYQYVKPTQANCQLICQVYYLARYFLHSEYPDVAEECDERLQDLTHEFSNLYEVQMFLNSNKGGSSSYPAVECSVEKVQDIEEQECRLQTNEIYRQLLDIELPKKKLLENIYSFLQKKEGDINVERKIEIYYRCLEQGPDNAYNAGELLENGDLLKLLLLMYKNENVYDEIKLDSSVELTILKAFCMHELGQTHNAVDLLINSISLTDEKKHEILYEYSLAHLQHLNGETSEALESLNIIEPLVSTDLIMYESILTNEVLMNYEQDNITVALRIGNFCDEIRIIKMMIILLQYEFAMPFDELLEELEQSCGLRLNEFDSALLRAMQSINATSDEEDNYEVYTEALSAISQAAENIKHYVATKPANIIHFHYFNFELEAESNIANCLRNRVSELSVLFSDLFNRKRSAVFIIIVGVTLELIMGSQQPFDEQLAELAAFAGESDMSWTNNLLIYLLINEKHEMAESLVNELGDSQMAAPLKEAFKGEEPQEQVKLSDNPEIRKYQVHIGEVTLELSLVIPSYPVTLPEIYDKNEFFNPINQVSLQSIVEEDSGMQDACGEQAERARPQNMRSDTHKEPINCLLQLDYSQDQEEKNNYFDSFEEPMMQRGKVMRAKSARPLLKIQKSAGQKLEERPANRAVRAGFRRLEPIKGESGSLVIQKQLGMPGKTDLAAEQFNNRIRQTPQEAAHGEKTEQMKDQMEGQPPQGDEHPELQRDYERLQAVEREIKEQLSNKDGMQPEENHTSAPPSVLAPELAPSGQIEEEIVDLAEQNAPKEEENTPQVEVPEEQSNEEHNDGNSVSNTPDEKKQPPRRRFKQEE